MNRIAFLLYRVAFRQLGPALVGAAGLLLAPLLEAADLATISQDIVQNIESAQRELSRTEQDISTQRQALAIRLNAAQNTVEALREQVISARRLADEQTLSLNQLEERLQEWREQSLFQNRLLASFSDLTLGPRAASATDVLPNGLQNLERFLARQQDLRTGWQAREIVLTDGQLLEVPTLQLGPVAWYWQPDRQTGGLLDASGATPRVALPFAAAAGEGLAALYQGGQGDVTFDPTLSRALLLAVEQESLLEHLQKGGIWVIPILLFALFATVVAVLKALMLWRLPKLVPALPARVETLAQEGVRDFAGIRAQLQGAQAELFGIALQPQTPEQCDDRLFACLLGHKQRLESWLGAIAVTAAVAPLLGLLGTVSGMITTFKLMTLFGAGDPSLVSGGISEALVTTELGLVVAIPALLAHALMSRRVKSYFSQLETDAIGLSQLRLEERRA
jgi:biopolymer transport protein ExbB